MREVEAHERLARAGVRPDGHEPSARQPDPTAPAMAQGIPQRERRRHRVDGGQLLVEQVLERVARDAVEHHARTLRPDGGGGLQEALPCGGERLPVEPLVEVAQVLDRGAVKLDLTNDPRLRDVFSYSGHQRGTALVRLLPDVHLAPRQERRVLRPPLRGTGQTDHAQAMLPPRVAIGLALDDDNGSRYYGPRQHILPVERGTFPVSVPERALDGPHLGADNLALRVPVGHGHQRVAVLTDPLLDPGLPQCLQRQALPLGVVRQRQPLARVLGQRDAKLGGQRVEVFGESAGRASPLVVAQPRTRRAVVMSRALERYRLARLLRSLPAHEGLRQHTTSVHSLHRSASLP